MIRDVKLSDKYQLETGRAFMTGIQALVRLPLIIARMDKAAGHNTGGFISGYRGSPLGNYDMQLAQAKSMLDAYDVVVKPAVNEELGATAVWGSQHVPLFEGATKDGVFGIWYAKGPGVDRSGDVLKHANMSGVSEFGGVLALCGDDHSCKSSTLPNQSEFALADAEIPTLCPANIEEVLEFGVKGIAMSRFSGAWVGMITIADLMDAASSIDLDPSRFATITPDFDMPAEGLHIRVSDAPAAKEARHRHYKLPAAQAFARANGIDKLVHNAPSARIGIAGAGKAFLHVLDALNLLGIDEKQADAIGLRLWKVGLVWPLDEVGARDFGRGLEKVLVVEERRDVIEHQMKTALYGLKDGERPIIIGKKGRDGEVLIGDTLDLETLQVALAIFETLPKEHQTQVMAKRAGLYRARLGLRDASLPIHVRKPFFCAGCPHNSSTKIIEGSRGLGGIGCHYLVTMMPRQTEIYTHMGGEGVTWMGQSPFTSEKHVFSNLGDGTYFHSGILAVRQSIAAGVNITYKILYNDAVAMTGGQSVDGVLHPANLAAQLAAEGVTRIELVSDDPTRWVNHPMMPSLTRYNHRDNLEQVQKELREHEGVSVLLYDQPCATELRRRRKRGLAAKPAERIFINSRVCEGCGDCSVQSNCIAIGPKPTELGLKREIDQSACNVDASCVRGFCPSFVAVEGSALKKIEARDVKALIADLDTPNISELFERPCNILLTGVGGLGVTSLSAMIGMAAHLDGAEISVVDQNGMAQRGGGVTSQIRIAKSGFRVAGPRIALGEVDVIIAADMVTAHGKYSLPLLNSERSHGFLNTALMPTAEFTEDTETVFDTMAMTAKIKSALKSLNNFDATHLAQHYLGDSVFSNMILLGAAWQSGLIPLTLEAIERAIALNGAAVPSNLEAFALGRAHVLGRLTQEVSPPEDFDLPNAFDLNTFIARRVEDLIAYQDLNYADDYAQLVEKTRLAEQKILPNSTELTEAVARQYFRLKAYKDEYEVARLHSDPAFFAELKDTFATADRVSVFLAPPLFAAKDKATGQPRKSRFGPWMFSAFGLLKRLKFLRHTPLDIFGYSDERRMERGLVKDYSDMMGGLITTLTAENLSRAVSLAQLPQMIKGFGHIKEKSVAEFIKAREALLHPDTKAEPNRAKPTFNIVNSKPQKETHNV